MAKKTKNKNEKKSTVQVSLPQNIIQIGERVEENKNIYIRQPVYKEIHKFTKNKFTDESGGMLVGSIIEEFGKTNIIINGFIEAKFCEATPTTLTFTHQTWEYVHKEIDKKYKGDKILGWIHTHPNFGIFLSEYDKFIQQNFFSEEYQVAYVIDPIQNIEGFYFWSNGAIERCKGFYVYDKTGKNINLNLEKGNDSEQGESGFLFSAEKVLLAILSVAVLFLSFSNISTNSELKKLKNEFEKLEDQQISIVNSANFALEGMQNSIDSQAYEIQQIKNILTVVGIIHPNIDDSFTYDETAPNGQTPPEDNNTNSPEEDGGVDENE